MIWNDDTGKKAEPSLTSRTSRTSTQCWLSPQHFTEAIDSSLLESARTGESDALSFITPRSGPFPQVHQLSLSLTTFPLPKASWRAGRRGPQHRRSLCSRRNRGCTSHAATARAPMLQGNALPFGVPLAILWLWCWAPAKVGTQSKSKQNVFFRVGLTSLECSSQLFLCSLGCSLEASCHPKQGLKCQNHQSQVTALSCDDESIWEIWIWQSFSIWQVRLWLSFLSLERAWCQLNWLMTHPLLPSTSGWASRAAVRRWIF